MLSQKGSIVEQLDDARKQGEEAELKFLEDLDRECEEAKWQESGRDHALWRRNWAVYRMKHIQNKDERFPRPLENHIFSLIEGVRPIFSDNVPDVQIVALEPGLDQQEATLNGLWRWIAEKTSFDSFWSSLYDYLPQFGTTAGKVWWDMSVKGGCPRLEFLDPRSIASDPLSRLNHRNASVMRTKHLVDIGELRSMFPDLRDKISNIQTRQGSSPISYNLSLGRDTGIDSQGQSVMQASVAEVVEMWIKPDPDLAAYSETPHNAPKEGEAMLGSSVYEPWIVYTYVPGAGIIGRDVATHGLQIATGQCWRNPDALYGISDVEMIVGLQIAMDQLAIRGHAHRLALFAPPLVLPRDSGVNRRTISGRAAPIWEPDTGELSNAIRFLQVPGPSQEALQFFAERPQMMRRILGIDELTTDVLQRQQTASAVAQVSEALESRTRQKIRNMNNLVVDLCKSAVCMAVNNLPDDVAMRSGDEYQVVSRMELDNIDLSKFAVKLATDKTGPLTKMGKVNAIRQAIELGVFSPELPLPIELRESIVDGLSLPRGEEVKRFLRERDEQAKLAEQAAMAQQQQALATPAPAETALPGGEMPEIPVSDMTDEELDYIVRN